MHRAVIGPWFLSEKKFIAQKIPSLGDTYDIFLFINDSCATNSKSHNKKEKS